MKITERNKENSDHLEKAVKKSDARLPRNFSTRDANVGCRLTRKTRYFYPEIAPNLEHADDRHNLHLTFL